RPVSARFFARSSKRPAVPLLCPWRPQAWHLCAETGIAAADLFARNSPPRGLRPARLFDVSAGQHFAGSALGLERAETSRRTAGGGGRSPKRRTEWGNAFAVSSTGVLAYRSGTTDIQHRWFTRDGKPDGAGLQTGHFNSIQMSPDSKSALI